MPNYNSKKKPKHTQFEPPPPPLPPSGIRPPAESKGPVFGTFKKSSFGQPTLKFF